ncbi:MAG TPA: hypothetical protein VG323_19365, partial [Thermoanaerobaculia bacterium]|nr:hypothetical protein [Thermoanaerobaculia bacterium]
MLAGALLCLLAGAARAATIAEPTTGISVTVSRDGIYTIQTTDPAWTFSGTVAGGAVNIGTDSGRDAAGAFQEILFEEHGKSGRAFGIRTWAGRPGVLFSQTVPDACANPPAFPRFSTFPVFPHNLSFAGTWAGV